MTPKKDTIFCFRIEEELDTLLRAISSRRGVSASFFVRKILVAYLTAKGLYDKTPSK